MKQTKKQLTSLPADGLAQLLHKRGCPMGYACLASDCVECLQKYIEREGLQNGDS
jgi:hypothetical protein